MKRINGIVVIDKPAGMTSHDVVAICRKLFRTKRVGHTGTLDPDATGVLVVCIEQATRLAEYLSAARKAYVTEVVFGIETDSQDASGTIVARQNASHLTETDVQELLPKFTGNIEQIPPMVSALHHEGKRLYELAREGITVERAARKVSIDRLVMTSFQTGEHPSATLEVTCSTGTYIRTLAADIGTAAGTGAMMRSLRRVWVGENEAVSFSLTNAWTLDQLREKAEDGTLPDVLLPLDSALRSWSQVPLDSAQETRIRHGQRLALAELTSGETLSEGKLVALLDGEGALCAVARVEDEWIAPVKVLQRDATV